MNQLNPYVHNQEPTSNRAMEARQKNTMEILNKIIEQNQQTKPDPTIQAIAQPIDAQEAYVPAQQIQQRIEADAYDENGNFKQPPVEGYWLGMLESINVSDPFKHGRDWRDEAIDTFKATRMLLNEMEASLR